MKIIQTKHFPFKGFCAINIFGVCFVRSEYAPIGAITYNHEAIHTAQMRETAFVLFYLWYGIEFLVRWLQYRDRMTAYLNISFEREAYTYQATPNYLLTRKHYTWVKLLNKKS